MTNRITQYELQPEFTSAMVAAGFGKPKPIPDADNFAVVGWPPEGAVFPCIAFKKAN